MKSRKKNVFLHAINVITVALIIESFLCAMLAVRRDAREDCLNRIAENTRQMSEMFNYAMIDDREKLTAMASILAANGLNTDEMLYAYMENFCQTQDFTALCIHRADDTSVSYGVHPHEQKRFPSFAYEVQALPYVSNVFSMGEDTEEKLFYQAVPIVRNGENIAILYGYMSLDVLPRLIGTTAYDGKCQLYIVDGDSGDFLMDTWHSGALGNIFDGSMGGRETKPDFEMNEMLEGVRNGRSGYFIFRSKTTGDWFYTYYMPLGINNWSVQLTIDETTAFASYNNMSLVMAILFICVVVLMLIHLAVLMIQNLHNRRSDQRRLSKANYMYEVQRALLNAHNNPDYIAQALKTVAEKVQAETALLLSFADQQVKNVCYWPSKDRITAIDLLNRNIRDDFPILYDQLIDGNMVVYDSAMPDMELSEMAKGIFVKLEVSDIVIAPISDPAGILKGALCVVNRKGDPVDCEMLNCVTYDFFMAVTNVENHAIIKNMSAMDYLTKIKNRNSYEAEIDDIAVLDCASLWCVFVDVNGLHEINNTKGHKAGDRMLCAVAETLKKIFGSQYTYRLGGDEFIAFAVNSGHEALMQKKRMIIASLAAKGYHVSVGFNGETKPGAHGFDIENMVAAAEEIMYRDKWEFYQAHNLPSERGRFLDLNQAKDGTEKA